MERPEILRPCGRKECGFSHPEKYCEIEGQDISVVTIVTEMLDEVLYSDQDIAPTDLIRIPLEKGDLSLRTFSLRNNEAVVRLQHFQGKNLAYQHYDIMIDWAGGQTLLADEPHQVEYSLTRWPEHAQAIITEYNLTAASLEDPENFESTDRLMTPYDHEQLFDLLSEVDDIQRGIIRQRPSKSAA